MAKKSQQESLSQAAKRADEFAAQWPKLVEPHLRVGGESLYDLHFTGDAHKLSELVDRRHAKRGTAPHVVWTRVRSMFPRSFVVRPIRDVNELREWLIEKRQDIDIIIGLSNRRGPGVFDANAKAYIARCLEDAVAWMEFFGLPRVTIQKPADTTDATIQFANLLTAIDDQTVRPRAVQAASSRKPLWLSTLERARRRFEILADKGFRSGLAIICANGDEIALNQIKTHLSDGYLGTYDLDQCGYRAARMIFRYDERPVDGPVKRDFQGWHEFDAIARAISAVLCDPSITIPEWFRLTEKERRFPHSEHWAYLLFAASWQLFKGSPLNATRQVLTPNNFAVADEQSQWLIARSFYQHPEGRKWTLDEWPDERPSAHFSHMKDVANASVYLIDVLINSIERSSISSESTPPTHPSETATISLPDTPAIGQVDAVETGPANPLATFEKHDVDLVRQAIRDAGGPEAGSKKVLGLVKMNGANKGRILRALAAAKEYRGYTNKRGGS